MKDRLEKYMYASVCRVLKEDGEESAKNLLDTYQKEIAKNWIEAYKKYIVEAGLDKNDKSAKRCVAK